jgi:TIR domain-containing protein
MNPAPIFISHRSEYARVARDLKRTIENTSQGHLDVFISEDIPRAAGAWRPTIEKHLREAQCLFLIYGAPYEDWSWCFYEAGYFTAANPPGTVRPIYCLVRPNVEPPGPLGHLQMATCKDHLIRDLMELYERNGIDFDAGDVRTAVATTLEQGLFGRIAEFDGYPRVRFTVQDAAFGKTAEIPATAVITGDQGVLGNLFRINASSISWADVMDAAATDEDRLFMSKWVEETACIILAARKNRFIAPQTVLIGRGGLRYRTVLDRARIQGDGTYACEFLAIDDVGGPATGLSSQQLTLLTTIRLGFRFRAELIQKFGLESNTLSQQEREARIQGIPRIVENLTIESRARGNINPDDLLAAFDTAESERMQKLLASWPVIKRELYRSMGLTEDGKTVGPGLTGADIDRYRTAFEALRLLNAEFLSRCCARVSRMMAKSEAELSENAKQLEQALGKLNGADLKSAA